MRPKRSRTGFAANTTEFELTDNLRIKNVFGYRDLDYLFSSDVDGTALPMIGARTSTTGQVTLNPPLGHIEAEQLSDELQLLGTAFDDKLEWIVGAYWMQMEGSQTFPQENLGANPAWPQDRHRFPVGPSLAGGPKRLVPGFAGRRCRQTRRGRCSAREPTR